MPDQGKHGGRVGEADKTSTRRQETYESAVHKYNNRCRSIDTTLRDLEYGFERARVITQVLGTTHFQINQAVKATTDAKWAQAESERTRQNLDKLLGVSKADRRTRDNTSKQGSDAVGKPISDEESFDSAIAKLKNAPKVIEELMRMAEVEVDSKLIEFTQDATEVLEGRNIERSQEALRIWREAWNLQLEINHLYDPKQNRLLRQRLVKLSSAPNLYRDFGKLEEDMKRLELLQQEVVNQVPVKKKLGKLKGSIRKAMADMKNLKRTADQPLHQQAGSSKKRVDQ